MGRFMKECFVRQLGYRIDRDLLLARVSLAVAVRMRETDLLDLQGGKRLLCIPFRQAWPNELLADGLRKHEPARLVDKSREDAFVAFTFPFLWPIIANLAGNRHA